MKKLFIIVNDRFYFKRNIYYTNHNDLSSIVDSLKKYFNISLVCRFSKKEKFFKVSLKKIYFLSVFKFLALLVKGRNNSRFLIVSITPFNFLIFLMLKIFLTNKKYIFLYLRSDGGKELKFIYNSCLSLVYFFMHKIIIPNTRLILTSNNLVSKKYSRILLEPSELDCDWFHKRNRPNINNVNFLYLGRYRKEKGIIDFINLIKAAAFNFTLTVVGVEKEFISNDPRIKFHCSVSSKKKLIRFYDDCNIFILPSYTESNPKVIKESLARFRPVIIFDDIKHVAKNKIGVYICRRDLESLNKLIKFIIKNYKSIQYQMQKNYLPLKKDFNEKFSKILR